jgi:hypothetical protein
MQQINHPRLSAAQGMKSRDAGWLIMIWKGYERKRSMCNLRRYPRIFLEGHKETTKNIRHNNVPTGTRNWHITVKFSSVTTGANLQSCAA